MTDGDQNVTVKFRRWIKHQNHVTALVKAARIAAAARALSQRLHHSLVAGATAAAAAAAAAI